MKPHFDRVLFAFPLTFLKASARSLACMLPLLAVLCAFTPAVWAATFTVNSTTWDEDGICSTVSEGCTLGDAIVSANKSTDSSKIIRFNIPTQNSGYNASSGVFTIRTYELPPITADGVTIDGASQTASTGDSNPNGPEIEISGGGYDYFGLWLQGKGAIVRNVILAGHIVAVLIDGDDTTIESCYIGTDHTGLQNSPANSQYSQRSGVSIRASNSTIGGVSASKGNIFAYWSTAIEGEDWRGTTRIWHNIIRNSLWYGIQFSTGSASIRYNQISGGSALGIDLGEYDVTPNDKGDVTAPQNFPVINSAESNGASTTLTLSLHSKPNRTYAVDIFGQLSHEVNPSGFGAGKHYLTSVSIVTDASGYGTVTAIVPSASSTTYAYTATATSPDDLTSEFSCARLVNTRNPASVVTTTADTGFGSLRWAVNYVNAGLAPAIDFNIPKSNSGYNGNTGVFTIRLKSDSIALYGSDITVDGATQTRFTGNSNTQGPEIEITSGAELETGFYLMGDKVTLRNLLVNGFQTAIYAFSARGVGKNTIEGCFVGTDRTGQAASPNNGVYGPYETGITWSDSTGTIGGSSTEQRNIIGFAKVSGVDLGEGATNVVNNTIFRNGIGINSDSHWPGYHSILSNTITENVNAGVRLLSDDSNIIVRYNQIYGNGGLGIDLGPAGVTTNDSGDSDEGPNGLQNFPVITGQVASDGTTTIRGTIASRPNSPISIDVYRSSSSSADGSGHGEAEAWVASTDIITDSSGNGTWSISAQNLQGSFVTATATHKTALETSEFSANFALGAGINVAPQTISVTPGTFSSASGVARTISTVYRDANGNEDIAFPYVFVGSSLTSSSGLAAYYHAANNRLWLRNGTTYVGGFAPGSANIISVPQGSLNCAASSVARNGNDLVVNWNFTPSSEITGANKIFLTVYDKANLRGGWDERGAWNILSGTNTAPVVVGISPSGGSSAIGVARDITATYSDAEGASDIGGVRLLINDIPGEANALCVTYNRVQNKLFVLSQDGTKFLGGFAPGSNNVISNSRGSLNCAATTVTLSGNVLTVKWNLRPIAGLSGTKKVYALVKDVAGLQDGYKQMGTWTLPANVAPVNGAVSPGTGSSVLGAVRTIATSHSDNNGRVDMAGIRLLVGNSTSLANAFCVTYNNADNKLYVIGDDGKTFWGGVAPGTNRILSNGRGQLDCSKTTITREGNTITVNWALIPKAGLVGTQNLYSWVKDFAGLTDGLEKTGTWTVTAGAAATQNSRESVTANSEVPASQATERESLGKTEAEDNSDSDQPLNPSAGGA